MAGAGCLGEIRGVHMAAHGHSFSLLPDAIVLGQTQSTPAGWHVARLPRARAAKVGRLFSLGPWS